MKNVEVVVRSVSARVALSAERRAEDNEILGDARVNDIHRTLKARK